MKFETLHDFEKHLEGTPAGLYLILGKEPFERRVAVDRIVAKVLTAGARDVALKLFDGDRLDPEALMTELNTFGFFTPKRVVVVDNADQLKKAATELLESYYQNLNPSVCLVLSATTLNRATNFYKKGEKAGVALEFPEAKPWEKEKALKEWVIAQVAASGKKIEAQAAAYLVKQLGTDQALLYQELQKLYCYVDDRPEITLQDIGAISTSVNTDTGWQLGEALFRRDAPNALRISKALLEDGTALISLIRQIRTQMQTQFQVCTLLSSGGTAADVSKQFPYMRGQILDRNMQMAQGYGLPTLTVACH